MEGLVYDISNNNGNNNGWGTGWSAAAGAFVGSAVGNGGLWGNRAGYNAGGQVVADTAILDAVNNVGGAVNSANIANIQGQNQLQNSTNQGFAGTVNAMNQGFSGTISAMNNGFANANNIAVQGFASVTATDNQNTAALQSALCQGFSGLNTQTLISSRDVIQAIDACCCATQKAIIEEGCKTRELIQNNLIAELQVQVADGKIKASQLEQTLALDAKIDKSGANIISHVAQICGNLQNQMNGVMASITNINVNRNQFAGTHSQ